MIIIDLLNKYDHTLPHHTLKENVKYIIDNRKDVLYPYIYINLLEYRRLYGSEEYMRMVGDVRQFECKCEIGVRIVEVVGDLVGGRGWDNVEMRMLTRFGGWGGVNGETRNGETRSGEAGSGETRSGETRSGEARSGETRSGEARSGEARNGETRNGEARNGEARNGEARNGEARSGEARSGEKEVQCDGTAYDGNRVMCEETLRCDGAKDELKGEEVKHAVFDEVHQPSDSNAALHAVESKALHETKHNSNAEQKQHTEEKINVQTSDTYEHILTDVLLSLPPLIKPLIHHIPKRSVEILIHLGMRTKYDVFEDLIDFFKNRDDFMLELEYVRAKVLYEMGVRNCARKCAMGQIVFNEREGVDEDDVCGCVVGRRWEESGTRDGEEKARFVARDGSEERNDGGHTLAQDRINGGEDGNSDMNGGADRNGTNRCTSPDHATNPTNITVPGKTCASKCLSADPSYECSSITTHTTRPTSNFLYKTACKECALYQSTQNFLKLLKNFEDPDNMPFLIDKAASYLSYFYDRSLLHLFIQTLTTTDLTVHCLSYLPRIYNRAYDGEVCALLEKYMNRMNVDDFCEVLNVLDAVPRSVYRFYVCNADVRGYCRVLREYRCMEMVDVLVSMVEGRNEGVRIGVAKRIRRICALLTGDDAYLLGGTGVGSCEVSNCGMERSTAGGVEPVNVADDGNVNGTNTANSTNQKGNEQSGAHPCDAHPCDTHDTVINKEESKIDFKELTMDLSLIKDKNTKTRDGTDVHQALKHVIYLLSKDDNKVRVHLVHNITVLSTFGEEYVHEVLANLLRNMDDKNWRYRVALIDGLRLIGDAARYAPYFEDDDVYFVRKYFGMVVRNG
ncbi:hypothetical protein VCUG_02204 [Vavraia culicis subsp. floridensis]|uniref:Uncharacterized protein n=1 Tax=Vavraia culicis (isolate floridensis) TaxID=948595 RepID=L2GRN6_VAVCU|nr:uncharacterized protein VCUG_02204 [Vavraia culicis subsp. floridensis]ELA46316.1 hypothetical protein VCUG_02204 [Vavraia culicis subsp. floridensis]